MSDDPTYLRGDSLTFDDDGTVVPVELPQFSTADTLEDCLLSHGMLPTEALMTDLDSITDDIARAKTSAFVRHMFSKLEGTSAAVALRWVVLGTGDKNMRDQAASIDVSHQAILKQAKTIRKKLGYQAPPK